ncbi:MoaD/ThiS family protein [Actinomadura sp. ATCC 31491]|uniref:MoaD/ThiS family protein n=1 Tax=Actinomadura luzonensis TaxID=2805427 RepID=A0ABT0FTX0_9ACTN|nr:MoaD/ThiS family protein [Actinomadura luzonensis]MCK2215787.1 MoaD/ThiS family protein [Actinomadura luzonensis]
MTFRFSGALLRYVDYNRTAVIDAVDLGTALALLEERHPQLRPVLRDATGELRRTHQVFLNGERIPRPSPHLPLRDSDEVVLLTAIAAG